MHERSARKLRDRGTRQNKSHTEGMARSWQNTQNLCLRQTNLHMRVAMQVPPNKQNCTRSTLPAAEKAQQQVAPHLWIPTLASMCLLVQPAALVPAGYSIVQLHVGCTVRSPPPLPPNHTATWCLRRPVFHKSQRPAVSRQYHNASFSPLLQQLQPPHTLSQSMLGKFLWCGWRWAPFLASHRRRKGRIHRRVRSSVSSIEIASTSKCRTLHCHARCMPLRIAVYISRPRSHTTFFFGHIEAC